MTICLGAKTDYSFMRGFGSPAQWLKRCEDIGVTHFCVADWCGTWGHAPFTEAFKGSKVKLLYGVQIAVTETLGKDNRFSVATLIAKKSLTELYGAVTLAHQQTFYRPRLTWAQVKELQDCVVIVNQLAPIHKRQAASYPVVEYHPVYPSPEHRQAYELVQAISAGHRIGDFDGDAFHLLRDSEVKSRFPGLKIDAKKIVKQCTAELAKGSIIVMDGNLEKLTLAGAKRLKIDVKKEPYKSRLAREFAIIREKNFENYFLFVNDLVAWAKERMFVGPGRGSAGGSLICYLLGITTVDPIKFGTLFERFIDITRPDLPDIDIDFPDVRREEVFEYLRLKYGSDRVARLGTISDFKGKSALNDTARATGVPFDAAREVGKWTEGAGQGVVLDLARVFEWDEPKAVLEKFPDLKLAELIDGHPRHHGVHAAGVVVTEQPVSRYGSVDKAGVIQMDMKTAEKLDLVKMDALGLRTLSVIQETCDLAGIKPETLYDLDWQDQKVYKKVFNADRVTGIFQFEGHAVRTLLRQVHIDKFDDLCAITSLARPGPLVGGAAENWVKARNGETVARAIHPRLESTYGTLTYQEQMMYIARDLAGFDEPSVNGMRRAVGKKDPEKLRSYREQFIEGLIHYERRQRNVLGHEGQETLGHIQGKSAKGYDGKEEIPSTSHKRSVCQNQNDNHNPIREQGASASRGVYSGAQADQKRGRASHGSKSPKQQSSQFTGDVGISSQESTSSNEDGTESQSNRMAGEERLYYAKSFSRDEAESLWDEISEFGSYAFNYSHAVEYCMISFMTAWLKLKYPLEFAVAQLRNAADDDSAKNMLRELIDEGYEYVPFDPQLSKSSWAIINGKLYGGFDSVRGVGPKTAEALLAKREADPKGWLDNLTEAQRERITKKYNTPWHELTYFGEKYKALYENPEAFKRPYAKAGFRGPVLQIKDIPDIKGNYAFIGRILRRQIKDTNDPERLAKRNGQRHEKDTKFANIFIEDDTGEIACTINRFKFKDFEWMIDGPIEGKDFFFRGNVIEDGRRWLFLDNAVELEE